MRSVPRGHPDRQRNRVLAGARRGKASRDQRAVLQAASSAGARKQLASSCARGGRTPGPVAPGSSSRRRPAARAAIILSVSLLTLFGLLLLLPSANVHRLAGFPLSRLSEFLGLILLAPFLISPSLRRLYGVLLHGAPALARRAVLGAAVAAVALKLLLVASGTHAGFLACYRSSVAPPPVGSFERSYENPF